MKCILISYDAILEHRQSAIDNSYHSFTFICHPCRDMKGESFWNLYHHRSYPPFMYAAFPSHTLPFSSIPPFIFSYLPFIAQVMILCVGNKTITSTTKRKVHSETRRRGLACDSFIRVQTYICFRRKDASRKKICRARHNIFLPFLKLYLLIIYIPRH